MFDKLNAVLKNICEEIGPNLYKSKDGIIRLSLGKKYVVVEFAENGIEADRGIFDDVGLYPNTDECLKEALLDLHLAEAYEDGEEFLERIIQVIKR